MNFRKGFMEIISKRENFILNTRYEIIKCSKSYYLNVGNTELAIIFHDNNS